LLLGCYEEPILNATDETWTGRRDHLLFLLLYNTGARISEILSLRVKDISRDDTGSATGELIIGFQNFFSHR
jgi:integrase